MDEPAPLQLPPELVNLVHQSVASVYKLPLEEVHADLPLVSLSVTGPFDFSHLLMHLRAVLRIGVDVELKNLRGWFRELHQGTATAATKLQVRRFIPNGDSLADHGESLIYTVGTIERMCAAAIESQNPTAGRRRAATCQDPIESYLATLSCRDQEWWASLPALLGVERFRLYLAGMLRAAYVESGKLSGEINELLEVAEKHAETGSNAGRLDKAFRGLSRRKLTHLWHIPFWKGLLCVLKAESKAEDGGDVLFPVGVAFGLNQPQVIAAARQWQQSLIAPLQESRAFAEEWRTPAVVALARQMYDNRTFGEYPQLGQLLEQARCKTAEVLNHCRNPAGRYLRGDWLINAILTKTAGSAASDSTARRTAVKTKAPKLPAMSGRQKKRFKELLMVERGGLPVAAAWSAVWQSEHGQEQQTYQGRFPGLSTDVLRILAGMYPALRTVSPDVAIARRWQLQDAHQLHQSLALYARMSLFTWHTHNSRHDLMEYFQCAFAAGDTAALQWAVDELPYESYLDTDVRCWSYLTFRAIFMRDETAMDNLIDRWPYPATSKRVPPIESVLLAILRRNRADVMTALNELLKAERKLPEPAGFGLVSLAAHACVRAAYWRDPALVVDFDVTQTAPWDSEFHVASMAQSRPLECFDFPGSPAPLRELLIDPRIPQWLRDLQAEPANQSDLIGLILTQVGPRPDSVYRQVRGQIGEWDRAEFDHRTAKLPITLTGAISRLTGEFRRTALQRAGATVEVVPCR